MKIKQKNKHSLQSPSSTTTIELAKPCPSATDATVSTCNSNSTSSSTNVPPSNSMDWESVSQWNDDSVAEVAGWWHLSPQQVAKLWQLHDRLSDVEHWKNQPNEVVRYLRDAHFHVGKAEQKFRRMIQWRINERVDFIVQEYQPSHPLMSEYIPTTVLAGCDKEGDPIWVERVGAADSWGMLQAFGHNDLIRYAVWIREMCIRGAWAKDYQAKHPQGRPPMRATAIIDLQGMTWDHLKPSLLPLLKDGLHIVQEYYCGFGKKIIVIRVSKLFSIIWKVAQHFCTENLKNMMVFATQDNYLEILEQYVDLETLPPCIYAEGGKGRGGVAMPNHLEGAKVPSWNELDAIWEQRQKQNENIKGVQQSISMSTASSSDDDEHDNGSGSTHYPAPSNPHKRNSRINPVVTCLGGGSFEFKSNDSSETGESASSRLTVTCVSPR